MPNALSITLSGLTAQQQRVSVAASNIANAVTTGRVPTATDSASTVYKPLGVSLSALSIAGGGAGVESRITEDQKGYSVIYAPSNVYANSEGLIAAPKVDLATEIVQLLESKTLFRAGISVIKTEREMMGALFDTIE